jgi:hypothetical protein
MATSDVKIDEGSALSLPTYTITEDAITKEIPRSALNSSDGTEIGTTADPINVALPTATVTALTPPAAISGFATSDKQLPDGHSVVLAAGTAEVGKLAAGTNIIGAVKRDTINYTAIRKYYTYTGAVTDGIVWSPAEGKKWVITDIVINTSEAATVTVEDDLAGGDSVVMKFTLDANGGYSQSFQTPLISGEADADLIVTTSAGNIQITVSGYEI